MGKPRPPTPPDPRQTAAAQTSTNVATSVANTLAGQVSQRTPDGSLNFEQNGTINFTDPNSGQTFQIPQFTAVTELSPELERIRQLGNQTQENLGQVGVNQSSRLNEILGTPFDPNIGTPGFSDRSGARAPNLIDSYETDFSADRQRVEDALLGRLNGHVDRDRESLHSRLADQGISVGTEAYARANEDFDESANNSRVSAILAAGQEQSRLANLSRDAAAFTNQARQIDFSNNQQLFDAQDRQHQQRLQASFANRNQPLNEISALLAGSQVQTPQFSISQPSQIPTTDFAGLVNQNFQQQNQNFQARLGQRGQVLGGLFGLGSAAIGAL